METDGNDMVTYGNSFKVPVCYIIIDTLEILNRQEMEDRVIDLYYNKKKTYREIEKLVRKSPRDIRTILNKVEPPEHSMSVSSRAYKLFSEHKSPTEVAIARISDSQKQFSSTKSTLIYRI